MSCVAQRCVEDKNNAERRVTSTTESLRDRSDRAGGRRAKGRDKGRASPRRRGGERALPAGEPANRPTARPGEIEIAACCVLSLQLEPDADGHLELGNLPVLDGTALLYDLKPIHMGDRLSSLDDRGLHSLGEALRRGANHVNELVDSGHGGAPY